MPKGYRPYLPDQDLLLPPNPREWVAEEHLVYFVSDVVDQLDLSAIQAVYGEENRRQPPYDPRLMTKLLYGYSMGLFGVQRMAQRNVIIRHLPGCRNFGFGKQNLPRRNWHAYTYGDDGGICHYRRISLQRYGPGLHNRRSNPGKRKAAGENPVLKLIGPSRHTLQRFRAW